jgi:predicted DNA-binding transcriptional regulator AlpA
MKTQNTHLFQLTTNEFIEIIKEVVLSVVTHKENKSDSNTKEVQAEYLTREDAKKLLRLSYTTLWKYDKEKILPARRIGSRVYYLKSDIEQLLDINNNRNSAH